MGRLSTTECTYLPTYLMCACSTGRISAMRETVAVRRYRARPRGRGPLDNVSCYIYCGATDGWEGGRKNMGTGSIQ